MKNTYVEFNLPIAEVPKLVRTESFNPSHEQETCEIMLDAISRFNSPLPSKESVWRFHAEHSQRQLFEVLKSGDIEELKRFFRNIHYTHIFKGYDQNIVTTNKLDESEMARTNMATDIYKRLIRLSSALGVCSEWNPRQHTGSYPYLEHPMENELTLKSMEALGVPSPLPVSGIGCWGLQTDKGILNTRQVLALGYLRELIFALKESGKQYSGIVEIGGGLGRLAYLACHLFGMKFSIIDIPGTSLTQYYFLRTNDIPTELWSKTSPGEGITLYDAFSQFEPEFFKNSLFINFDSLIEMDRDSQESYFKLISESNSDLLSVNHEANKIMTRGGHQQNIDISRFTKYGYAAGRRNLFWERQGYVSQFFSKE